MKFKKICLSIILLLVALVTQYSQANEIAERKKSSRTSGNLPLLKISQNWKAWRNRFALRKREPQADCGNWHFFMWGFLHHSMMSKLMGLHGQKWRHASKDGRLPTPILPPRNWLIPTCWLIMVGLLGGSLMRPMWRKKLEALSRLYWKSQGVPGEAKKDSGYRSLLVSANGGHCQGSELASG